MSSPSNSWCDVTWWKGTKLFTWSWLQLPARKLFTPPSSQKHPKSYLMRKILSRPFAGLWTRNHHQHKSHLPSFLGSHSSDTNFHAIKQANKSSHTCFLIKTKEKISLLALDCRHYHWVTGPSIEILTALGDCLEFSKSGHPRLPFASTTRTTAIKVSVPSGLDDSKYPWQNSMANSESFRGVVRTCRLDCNPTCHRNLHEEKAE